MAQKKSLERTRERRPDLLERSFQVTGGWFGRNCGVLVRSLTDAVSRYGSCLDLKRKYAGRAECLARGSC